VTVSMGVLTVAAADTFLESFAALPRQVQPRVREFTKKLRADPTHNSLNYERIARARDPHMRSVRVTQDYRAIVAHLDGTDTYLLLWIAKHDDAYTWAERHRLDLGGGRLGLAILPVESNNVAALEEPNAPATPPSSLHLSPYRDAMERPSELLSPFTDDQLAGCGVPASLIPALRQCSGTQSELLDALSGLREEVAEAVFALVTGEPPSVQSDAGGDDAVSIVVMPETESALDPLAEALQRPDSARRFVVLNDQLDLEQALAYPLDRWRVFLHPNQRAIVTSRFEGPALVTGGPGTGKTVVGMHRARYLAQHVFSGPEDRILLTTFTKNLAQDLSDLMDSLCGSEHAVRARIDVRHVHGLASDILRAARESFAAPDENTRLALMRRAAVRDTLGLPVAFYLAEWDDVVQERDVFTEDIYIAVERSGRGRGLTPRQRRAIWPVLAAYRQELESNRKTEWADVVRRARQLVESRHVPIAYRSVVVDEAQDMGAPEVRLLLTLAVQGPDSMLLLADQRQQIYARGSYIKILNLPIGRRHKRLTVNYRTTEQIRSAADTMFAAGDTSALTTLSREYSISLMRGPTPRIHAFATQAEEVRAVVAAIMDATNRMRPEEIVLVARSQGLAAPYVIALREAGIEVAFITRDNTPNSGVRVSTMHRVKGLEFRSVFIVACSANCLPQPHSGEDDVVAETDHRERERRLLYVAMTRAREDLWISGPRPLSPFLDVLI
jgi:mRNA-degrading endonuclease RelE of RelBE toxin-antitoxin system